MTNLEMSMYLHRKHPYPLSWYLSEPRRLKAMYFRARAFESRTLYDGCVAQIQANLKVKRDALSEKLIERYGTDKMTELSSEQRREIFELTKKGLL